MHTFDSELRISSNRTQNSCVVESSLLIGQFLDRRLHDRSAVDDVGYLVITSREGQIQGVASVADLLAMDAAWNDYERARWRAMPISALLTVQLVPMSLLESGEAHIGDDEIACTAIRGRDGVLALVAQRDVFVSWKTIQGAIEDTCVDPVTRLPNRLMYDRRVSEDIERANRTGQSVAIVLIDVDHFKQINDQFGHSAGDAALQEIACSMRASLRSTDFLARYGGDEFAIVCSGCRPGDIAVPIRKLQSMVRQSFRASAVAMPPVTLSIGAAVQHDCRRHLDPAELIELADMCLYRAKENGRACAFKMELDAGAHTAPIPERIAPLAETDLPPETDPITPPLTSIPAVL